MHIFSASHFLFFRLINIATWAVIATGHVRETRSGGVRGQGVEIAIENGRLPCYCSVMLGSVLQAIKNPK